MACRNIYTNNLSSLTLAIILFFFIPVMVLAQKNDSTRVSEVEFITDQMERIAQNTDQNLDYSDLLDDYLYYHQNPVDLNSKVEKLLGIHLINSIQLNNLTSYIHTNGPLNSVFELRYVPGFDNQTIQNMLPFVTVLPSKQKISLNPSHVFKYGKNKIILRYNQYFEKSAGYLIPKDSALSYPGSVYLGNMQAWYVRYGFNYKNKVRIGFTLDKDAGEIALKNNISDSIRALVGHKMNTLFDYFSSYIYVSDLSIVKAIVLGDYHLEFGQGLTLWSGLAFGKSAEALQIKRYGRGVRPNTSRDENRFFRGGAMTLGWKGISFTGFYSHNKVDASIVYDQSLSYEQAGSLPETGLHRTINELLRKHTLTITAAGGRLSYSYKKFKIGATAYQSRFSVPVITNDALYKKFGFAGDNLMNYGADFTLNFSKLNFFGEMSASSNKGLAGLAGMNAFLSDRFAFTLFYHNYGKKYFNLYNNPVDETSSFDSEQGIYFGFRALLHARFSLSGYLDYYAFPWLKYRTDGPSTGRDYLLQLNYTATSNLNMYLRLRYSMKQENFSGDYDYLPQVVNVNRSEFRFFISYHVFDFLILKNRLEYVWYKKEFNPREQGYLIYQDVLYRPARFPLDVTFRYALFSTDGFNSRIYTYENDVLYAFSIPSYFDNGQRVYLLLRYRALKQLDVWLRIARTVFSDRNTIGSGADEIDGNHKTEIKVQVMVKL